VPAVSASITAARDGPAVGRVFDPFPLGGIVPQVTGEQLEWLKSAIADNPGVWHLHCHKMHHTMNAHAEVPLGVMAPGGMTTLMVVEPGHHGGGHHG